MKKLKVTPIDTFVKNCIHEQISITANGEIIKELWGIYAENFPCDMCRRIDNILFVRISPPLNMVVKTCKHCGITEPMQVRDPRTNDPIAALIRTEVITVEEALKFVEKYRIDKRFLPPRLANVLRRAIPVKQRTPEEIAELQDVQVE